MRRQIRYTYPVLLIQAGFVSEKKYLMRIIDVSADNGQINWAVVAQNADEVIIRTSIGYGDVDKNASVNANGAAGAGMQISYYHVAYPHAPIDPVEDATKQAQFFLDTISTLPAAQDMVIDLETKQIYSQDSYAQWLQTFVDAVEAATGKKMVIYTYADYLNRSLPDNHQFGSYPLWIANYSASGNPPLPKGWTDYYMWQYSQSGAIPGINGNVDLSALGPNTVTGA